MNILQVIERSETDKPIELRSDHEIKIICGKSSITLTPEGKITIEGTQIIKSADRIENFANRVDYW